MNSTLKYKVRGFMIINGIASLFMSPTILSIPSLLPLPSDMKLHLLLVLLFVFEGLAMQSQGIVENQGQWYGSFDYRVDIKGGTTFIEKNGLTFHFVDRSGLFGPHYSWDQNADNIEHHHVMKFKFLGCNPHSDHNQDQFFTNYNNYYLGANPDRWKTKIYPSHQVIYEDIYEGVDLRYLNTSERLKYEFIVKPGSDYRVIRIKVLHADGLHLDRDGNLIINTSIGDLMETKPVVYQQRGNKKWQVEAEFVLSNNTVSYSIPQFDTTLPLVIDPELIFSTFSGSTSDNWGYTATPDRFGNLYGGSGVYASGYPTTVGAYDISYNGPSGAAAPSDVAISKFNSGGTNLVYSTYFGGERTDLPHSLIVDEAGNLFLLGTTSSDSLPTTTNAIDRTINGGTQVTLSSAVNYAGSDIFVTKFNNNGTALIGSTYIGGSGNDGLNTSNALQYNYADESRGEINLDNDGNVIVVSSTYSDDFPGTNGQYQSSNRGNQEGIIAKLTSDLTNILWSTYLGGNSDDACFGVAVAEDNSLYVCGGTASSNFPTTTGSFQPNYNQSRCDGFVSHLSANGKTLLHSTFHGSNTYDQMYLIQLDRNGHPHVFGQTQNNGNYFMHGGAAFNDVGGGQVVTRFRPDLNSVVWSTQFGPTAGRPNISPTSFLVDVCNSIYIGGWGGNTNQNFGNGNIADVGGLPTTNDAFKQDPDASESEFYFCVLDDDADVLVYGSFFGGDQSGQTGGEHVDGGTSRFDRSGKIYQAVCAGCGGGSDFPIEPDPGAWSTTNGSSNCNLLVFKIDFDLPLIIADFNSPIFGCAPFTVDFDNQSVTQNSSTFFWNFGDGSFSTTANPEYTFTEAGTYTVQLIVSDPGSCNLHDTIEREIVVKEDTVYTLASLDTCVGTPIQIGPDPTLFSDLNNATFSWSPSQLLNNSNSLNPTATLGQTTTFTLTIDYGGCSERITQTVNIDTFSTRVSNDTIVCSTFNPFTIEGSAPGVSASYAWSRLPDFSEIIGTDSTLLVTDLPLPINRFFFRATKGNGCSVIDTVSVTVSDKDIALTNDTAVCQNEDALIRAVSQDPKNTFYYYWTLERYAPGTGQELLADTTANSVVINQVEPVTYHLYATSRVVEGCNARDSVRVQVSALSQAAVSVTAEKDSFYLGESVQLQGTPSDGFFFSWSPETYLSNVEVSNPLAKPKEEMTYEYTVTDRDLPECSFKDSVTIYPYEIICGEPEIFLPNAFSPDVNGLNDVLYLRGKNVKSMELSIYDRWGKLMFNTSDQSKGWDATFNGERVDNAVYVYYFEARCIDNQYIFRKGNITVLGRN